MENQIMNLGPKGRIKKHEFVRLIIQCLYSLGFERSAKSLEGESGIFYKSAEFGLLESQILSGNWDACIDTLDALKELSDETRASALFLVSRQSLLENLIHGDESLALSVLRKVAALRVGTDKVHHLAFGMISLKETGLSKGDDDDILELRKKLLTEMEQLLPPPLTLPERRLEHLVEMAVDAQIDSCMYHNSFDLVSLYEDHGCGRDWFPTETIQILTGHSNEVWFVQFSNNGEYLASSSRDCTAIIWKVLEDGKLTLKHTLQNHQKPVFFLAWSPDDTMLLTCGNKEVLKLWDAETALMQRRAFTCGTVRVMRLRLGEALGCLVFQILL
ncbi:WD repeat-containing protein WDS homolog isoform X2 [Diospyros lotus]|uniref:WD repeat-containing protein WDS homolog isoform X2 n=1 Tax=Diospyros lotus TaxID=55363 RepID=UPI00225A89D7|nr:WD repeat-containing protein WDS homolog isoform X2 [Diospyros lotus]